VSTKLHSLKQCVRTSLAASDNENGKNQEGGITFAARHQCPNVHKRRKLSLQMPLVLLILVSVAEILVVLLFRRKLGLHLAISLRFPFSSESGSKFKMDTCDMTVYVD